MLSVSTTGRGGKTGGEKEKRQGSRGVERGLSEKVKEEWLCITCRRHSVGSLLFIKLTFTGKWRLACKQSEYSVWEREGDRERDGCYDSKQSGTSVTGISHTHKHTQQAPLLQKRICPFRALPPLFPHPTFLLFPTVTLLSTPPTLSLQSNL